MSPLARRLLACVAGIGFASALAPTAHADDKVTTTFAAKIVASGPVKAYTGPEGERVAMLEINDGKEMLVQVRDVDPSLDGTTLRYLLEDQGDGNQTVYLDAKRGSKPYRRVVLVEQRSRWEYFQPGKPATHFRLTYSKSASEALKPDDLIKTVHP